MNVRELVDELEQYLPDGLDGEDPGPEVRLAIQPSYPFQHDIASIVAATIDEDSPHPTVVVYIAEGGQNYAAPYLPGAARDELGW